MSNNDELRIAVLGASGRMGGALLRAIDEIPAARLVGATASAQSRWLGQDASAPSGGPQRNVRIESNPATAVANAGVAIDFALPEATRANLDACLAARCALVLGTTGYGAEARADIERAAKHIPIVVAAIRVTTSRSSKRIIATRRMHPPERRLRSGKPRRADAT